MIPARDPLRTLRNEHGAIASVLHGLQYLAHRMRRQGVKPRLDVLRAMLFYIEQFPERQHHPREDEWLFSRLVQRAPETAPLVAELHREHLECPAKVRELEEALARYEADCEAGQGDTAARIEAFADAVDRYADFHWRHMRREEELVLPLARKHLTEGDLADIEAAFAGREDPLAGLREKDFEALFSRIVAIAPAPIGLGEPWPRGRPAP